MSEDIFVPTSSPDDALVSPLHTVTYVTAETDAVEQILHEGYGMSSSNWYQPTSEERAQLNPYFGFQDNDDWEACVYSMPDEGANVQIRVFRVAADKPLVRPDYDGLYQGGATMSCPMDDMRKHEKHMSELGVRSTMGVKEMEFTSPTGETYISAEIVYLAPDNVFIMGVTRPDIFVPVGPLNPKTGIGGVAYSARCVAQADATIEFLSKVLGYEIRRDVEFTVGEESAIWLPEGTTERFIQAFAPGSQTGYVVLMDHGAVTKRSDAPGLGVPNRGIGVWSFATQDLAEVEERARNMGCDLVRAPTSVGSPFLAASDSVMLTDPDGFSIEVFESNDS